VPERRKRGAGGTVVVIDAGTPDAAVETGSFNFTNAAENSNAENALTIDGAPDLSNLAKLIIVLKNEVEVDRTRCLIVLDREFQMRVADQLARSASVSSGARDWSLVLALLVVARMPTEDWNSSGDWVA
jgi:phosphatidylserine/phosphatidylglycerophosphate/cardiolipin synthase-like enzyme